MNCFKCSQELQSYDSDTRRWFEPSGKNHQCERIALYTKEPGFFVKLSPFAIASNITKIAEQNHWKQVTVERKEDWLILRPR